MCPAYETLTITPATPEASSKKRSIAKGGKIDKSMILGPKLGTFVHVAHMSYDADSGFTSTGVDPSWLALLRNSGVVRDYLEQPVAPKMPKSPPPRPITHVANESVSL